VDETRAFLAPFGLRFDPIGAERALDARFGGAFLSGIYVGYVRFDAAALIRVDPKTAYALEMPLRGRFEATSRGEVINCAARQSVVLSPTGENAMHSETGATRLSIAVKHDTMVQQLAALLGALPNAPLEFAAPLNLREGHGRSLVRFARLAIAELERPDTILLAPITARLFGEFVTNALLLHQPHNYSERLRRLARPVAPRDVKRAIDYIEANLDAAIGLPEIVGASGVPGRTLIQHFRDFKGTSPMRYLRAARYQKVRDALSLAEPEQSITEVASNWGFTHMGRFSHEYRRRFGESPSETLRRRRNSPSSTSGPTWSGRLRRPA
jgi:AraC-like DNA-binding protein